MRLGRYARPAVSISALLFVAAIAEAALSGAIFTTNRDGTRVNANLYSAKEDVYLDGGPGPQAKSRAAALPAGDYYFQVTDPSGQVLLSQDSVASRRFHVGAAGFIDAVAGHATGTDADYGDEGALTVQLMPYADTPNPGGVYKVWVTPVERFEGDPDDVAGSGRFHGFVPRWSKTDNYKVRRADEPCDCDCACDCACDATLRIRVFVDCDGDGCWDADEREWLDKEMVVEASDGTSRTVLSPATLTLEEGSWWIVLPARWTEVRTRLTRDGAVVATGIRSPILVEVDGCAAYELLVGVRDAAECGCVCVPSSPKGKGKR